MRRVLTAAESARFALLGLLLHGPRHGYDLARQFGPDTALGDIVHLSLSHLYALLGRLERDGLVTGQRQESGAYPPRHVVDITQAGRDTVLQWLSEPVEHPRDMQIEFPLKGYIAYQLDPTRAARLIEAQRQVFSAYARRLQEPRVDDEDADGAFKALMRKGRQRRAQAMLDWLDDWTAVIAVPAEQTR